MQPPSHPWTATIERLHLCRRPTRRGTTAGIRSRSRPITRVASGWCRQVSSVDKQTGVNSANLIALTSTASGNGSYIARSSSHLCAKFALISARSIRKQELLVRDYIDEHELNVVAITETWLAEGETTVTSELCGGDFTFVHWPRSGARRGGGVGVLFRKTLQLVSRADIDKHACETCCVFLRNIRIGCITRVIVVYRPPTSHFRTFLDDIGKILLIAAAHPTETVVCGDFNTRYGDSTCADAMNLADLLETHGFVQHVQGATHERGNTLDLVITSGTSHVIATTVELETFLTDHRVIECELRQPKPERMTRRVQYRKYSAIDGSRLTADLAAADLNVPEQNPEVILTRYDACIRSIVNAHAPVISRTMTARPMTPWHTSELSEEKRALRRAERNWRQTGLTVHRQIYTSLRNTFRKSLMTARSHYYRTELTSAGGNIRRVYQIANTLLGRAGDRPLPEDATQATMAAKFQESFTEKIDALRRNMIQSSTEDAATNVAASLLCFVIRMKACISEVKMWLYDNGLVLNESKTDAIVIHSSSLRRPIHIEHVDVCGQYVATSTIVRDLGVAIDADLSMVTQVANACRSAYYHLSRIARARGAMTISVCKCLVHALVTSRLDYGNAMAYLTVCCTV